MISVITISRQYGSGGSRFAQSLSKKCNYQLIWREVINKAAKQIGSPDVALAMIDELGLLGLCPDEKTCQEYIKSVNTVMHDYAAEGNIIIVGRASQVILKAFPGVLHIRMIASDNTRISNISVQKNISPLAAKAQIEESDRYRKNYLERFYQVDWNNPALYDLTINTDRLTIEQSVDLVLPLLGS
jgi:cytidylate kinase